MKRLIFGGAALMLACRLASRRMAGNRHGRRVGPPRFAGPRGRGRFAQGPVTV